MCGRYCCMTVSIPASREIAKSCGALIQTKNNYNKLELGKLKTIDRKVLLYKAYINSTA